MLKDRLISTRSLREEAL